MYKYFDDGTPMRNCTWMLLVFVYYRPLTVTTSIVGAAALGVGLRNVTIVKCVIVI